jgi:hypothetical protein
VLKTLVGSLSAGKDINLANFLIQKPEGVSVWDKLIKIKKNTAAAGTVLHKGQWKSRCFLQHKTGCQVDDLIL